MPVARDDTISPDRVSTPAPVNSPEAPYGAFGFPPTTLPAGAIAGYCYAAGFRGPGLVTAIAIALAESSGQTAAHGSYTSNGVVYDVWGLFQISTIHASLAGITVTQMTATDPLLNARMAFALSGGGHNWLPWQTFDGPPSQGYNGAYRRYVAEAQAAAPGAAAAAGNVASGFDAFIAGTNAAQTGVDPAEYSYTAKPSIYSKVVPVWHVGDITMELVAATGQILGLSGLKSIVVGGLGSTLEDLLIDCSISMDNSQSTQVTLTFEQGDVIAANGIGFPAQPDVLISKVNVRHLSLAVTSVSVVADAAGRPMWQIVCIAEAQMVLMDAFPPAGSPGVSTPGMDYAPGGLDANQLNPQDPSYDSSTSPASSESATQYMARMCSLFQVGPNNNPIPFYGETSNATLISPNTTEAGQPGTANFAGYNPWGDPASGTLPDSVWVYAQRLAGWFGFWLYEAGGAIWFAQPSSLVDWGNKLLVNYVGVGKGTPDSTAPIGTPRLAADIEETPGGFGQVNKRQIVRKISVDLAPWYGCQAKPGDELVLSGFWSGKTSPWDTNPDGPDHWTGVGFSNQSQWPKPGQKYIITSVNFKIDGGLSPVTVQAEEVRDPNPKVPGGTTSDPTSIVNAPNTGAVTTSYVVPSTVEASLTASYRTSRLAADALKLAVAQVGVPYRWGGTTPQTGFDCSGLVYWAATQVGVDPTNQPRTSQQLWAAIQRAHTQITVAQALNTPFALLFPADPSSAPSHVAISLGDGKTILQAPHTGATVSLSDYSANTWLVQAGTLTSLTYQAPTPAGQSPDRVTGALV